MGHAGTTQTSPLHSCPASSLPLPPSLPCFKVRVGNGRVTVSAMKGYAALASAEQEGKEAEWQVRPQTGCTLAGMLLACLDPGCEPTESEREAFVALLPPLNRPLDSLRGRCLSSHFSQICIAFAPIFPFS